MGGLPEGAETPAASRRATCAWAPQAQRSFPATTRNIPESNRPPIPKAAPSTQALARFPCILLVDGSSRHGSKGCNRTVTWYAPTTRHCAGSRRQRIPTLQPRRHVRVRTSGASPTAQTGTVPPGVYQAVVVKPAWRAAELQTKRERFCAGKRGQVK